MKLTEKSRHIHMHTPWDVFDVS